MLLMSVALTACGHSARSIAGTPWVWSSQWSNPQQAVAPTDSDATLAAAPVHVSQRQQTIVLPVTEVTEAAPSVVLVERQPKKQKADGKHAKKQKPQKRRKR